MSDVRATLVETGTHGRVLVREVPGSSLALIAFHGYAENAAIALDRLRGIPGSDRWTLVAIQALNRFYRGRTQETVASWMTREDRDTAISDNIRYVDAALDAALPRPPGRLVLAGFSQGVAMAFRAAVRGRHACSGVVAVGGDVPPELLADRSCAFPPVLLVRGERDDWYTQPKLDADVAALRARGVPVEGRTVDGGHEWNAHVDDAISRALTSWAPSTGPLGTDANPAL